MARAVPLAERGMDLQVALRELRKTSLPLFEAALASGDVAVMAEAKALDSTLKVAAVQARRLTGLADGISCPDGQVGMFHGRAA